MNGAEPVRSPRETLQVFDSEPGVCYDLETVVHLTGVPRHAILVYCKSGLVQPRTDDPVGALAFDDEAVYAIRRIEYLRSSHGINLAGVRMIFDLLDQLRHLQEEIRFLRR